MAEELRDIVYLFKASSDPCNRLRQSSRSVVACRPYGNLAISLAVGAYQKKKEEREHHNLRTEVVHAGRRGKLSLLLIARKAAQMMIARV